MKEKVKCKKCGLFIDSDCETCPYCGYPQKEDASETVNKNIESLNEAQDTQSVLDYNSNLNQEAQKIQKDSRVHFYDFESRVMNIKLSKSIMLFIAGFFVLNIIALIFQYIALGSDNWYFIASGNVNGAVNFAVYFMVFTPVPSLVWICYHTLRRDCIKSPAALYQSYPRYRPFSS